MKGLIAIKDGIKALQSYIVKAQPSLNFPENALWQPVKSPTKQRLTSPTQTAALSNERVCGHRFCSKGVAQYKNLHGSQGNGGCFCTQLPYPYILIRWLKPDLGGKRAPASRCGPALLYLLVNTGKHMLTLRASHFVLIFVAQNKLQRSTAHTRGDQLSTFLSSVNMLGRSATTSPSTLKSHTMVIHAQIRMKRRLV